MPLLSQSNIGASDIIPPSTPTGTFGRHTWSRPRFEGGEEELIFSTNFLRDLFSYTLFFCLRVLSDAIKNLWRSLNFRGFFNFFVTIPSKKPGFFLKTFDLVFQRLREGGRGINILCCSAHC